VGRLTDFAIMYRVNSQSRVFERTFLRHRIAHKVVGMRFYERKEIRDLLAYLRLVHNPKDVASFDRIVNVPPRQIGNKTLADLRLWAVRLGVTAPEAVELLVDGEDTHVACPLPARAQAALIDFGQTLRDLRRASQDLTVAALIDRMMMHMGYLDFLRDGTPEAESRLENIRELI